LVLKWRFAISIFLTACNRENGSLSIDPLDALDYPSRTYELILMIQIEFIKYIKAETDRLTNKARQRRT
jgi:hypothetical protein